MGNSKLACMLQPRQRHRGVHSRSALLVLSVVNKEIWKKRNTGLHFAVERKAREMNAQLERRKSGGASDTTHLWPMSQSVMTIVEKKKKKNESGLVRDLNPGPLAPKARIIPLDQRATSYSNKCFHSLLNFIELFCFNCALLISPSVFQHMKQLVSHFNNVAFVVA